MYRFSACVWAIYLFAVVGCGTGGGVGSTGPNLNVSQPNFEKLKEGMTNEQIEAVLGRGRKATAAIIDGIQPSFGRISEQHNYKLKETAEKGCCYVWNNTPLHIIVVYNKPPAEGGTLTYATIVRYVEGPDGSKECENFAHTGLL